MGTPAIDATAILLITSFRGQKDLPTLPGGTRTTQGLLHVVFMLHMGREAEIHLVFTDLT